MEPVERPAHVAPERVVDVNIFDPIIDDLDFHDSWKSLQDSDLPEVVWSPHNGGHWIVLRGKLVQEVVSDWQQF